MARPGVWLDEVGLIPSALMAQLVSEAARATYFPPLFAQHAKRPSGPAFYWQKYIEEDKSPPE